MLTGGIQFDCSAWYVTGPTLKLSIQCLSIDYITTDKLIIWLENSCIKWKMKKNYRIVI